MPDGVDILMDSAKLTRDADRLIRRYLSAGTETIAAVTKGLERALEDVTRGVAPGSLWRAWGSETFPRTGPARNPVGSVFVNGGPRTRGAMTFWTQPGAIRGRDGFFLAIPLPAAGPRGRKRMLTPGEWERAHGQRLRFVYRPGRPALLVADDAVLKGRGQVADRNTFERRLSGRGSMTIPIFVLLPVVKFRNAISIPPIVAAAERRIPDEFTRRAGAVAID